MRQRPSIIPHPRSSCPGALQLTKTLRALSGGMNRHNKARKITKRAALKVIEGKIVTSTSTPPNFPQIVFLYSGTDAVSEC
jgi:hypothetical protein